MYFLFRVTRTMHILVWGSEMLQQDQGFLCLICGHLTKYGVERDDRRQRCPIERVKAVSDPVGR